MKVPANNRMQPDASKADAADARRYMTRNCSGTIIKSCIIV